MRFLFYLVIAFSANCAFGADFRVGIWGNSAGEASKAVNFHRYGCKGVFERCEKRFESYSNVPDMGVVFFSPELTVEQLVDTAKKYSKFSLSHSNLTEVSADDFVDFLKKSRSMNNEKNMLAVISAIKSSNKNLRFAITLYENELNEIINKLPGTSANVREKVDRVAFYLRFRESGDRLDDYVKQLKSAFPNAQIDIGIYNYDRTGRTACARGRIFCSHQNDVRLLKAQLSKVVDLKNKGLIQGIEIYPGEFGRARNWEGWKKESICAHGKINECVKNSEELSKEILNADFLSKIEN